MTMTETGLTLADAHTRGFEWVAEHTRRFTDYIAALEPSHVHLPVPGSDWTVGETVAHVQSVYLRYTVDHRRVDAPSELAARNAEDVAALGVDVAAAAASILEQVELMAAVLPQVDPGQLFPFHGGEQVTMAAGWGNLLGELLAHGDDIARATGIAYTLPPEVLEVTWRFTAPVLRGWLRTEAAAHRDTWRFAFPFGPIDVTFDAGDMRWEAADPRRAEPEVDHVVRVDDVVQFSLTFPYRRRPVTDPTLALFIARFHDV